MYMYCYSNCIQILPLDSRMRIIHVINCTLNALWRKLFDKFPLAVGVELVFLIYQSHKV